MSEHINVSVCRRLFSFCQLFEMSKRSVSFSFLQPFHYFEVSPDCLESSNLVIPDVPDAVIWRRVDSEVCHFQGPHHRYWWKHAGYALAVLLFNAGYVDDAQYQILSFFTNVIAPTLGRTYDLTEGYPTRPSFMTDDGVPIELSWDWGYDATMSPTIRYSIEPVGFELENCCDQQDQSALLELPSQLIQSLSGVRLEWFAHFNKFFRHQDCAFSTQQSHASQIFYAFDLFGTKTTSKAYFFPAFKAASNRQPILEALSEAITTAPQCTSENLEAFGVFHEFAMEPQNSKLEFEMLAIDLVDPKESRLKIYFRSRRTDFNSLLYFTRLGGRISSSEHNRALEDLQRLWNAIFELDDRDPNLPLPFVTHRTSGILYNVEFKLGSVLPSVKVYIPVRHYASSDSKIIQVIDRYLQHKQLNKHMADFSRAMNTLLYVD